MEYKTRAQLMQHLKNLEKEIGHTGVRKVKQKIHVGLLYASPILYTDVNPKTKSRGYTMTPQLQFNKEKKVIKDQMRESGQSLVFKCAVATQENFIEMLTKSPRILHISCHGVDNPSVNT